MATIRLRNMKDRVENGADNMDEHSKGAGGVC